MKSKFFNDIAASITTIKRYKWNSIFFQYLKMFLTIILILMFILSAVFLTYFYNNAKYKVKNNINQSFSFVKNDVSFILDETLTLYRLLIVKDSVQAFMQVDDIDKLNSVLKNDLLDNYKFIRTYISSSKYIKSISMYSKSCEYILTPSGNNYLKKKSPPVWIKNSVDTTLYSFIPCDDSSKDFYLCYNVFENKKSSGIIAFRIDSSAIANIYSLQPENNLSIMLTDPVGNNISVCGDEINYERFDYDFDEKGYAQVYKKGTFSLAAKVGDVIIAFSEYADVIPIRSFVVMLIIITIVLIFIVLFLSLILSLKAYKIIDNLLLEINSIKGDGEHSYDGANEITYISANILNLINNNHVLKDQFVAASLNLRSLQLDILQTQLTPHFLFNVLNTLHMHLLKTYGVENSISNIIIKLSDILTLTLDTAIYMVSVEKEIEYTKKYIDVQRIMFDNRFEVKWDIDLELLNCYTLKFSLQPIVENAISHGIKPIITYSSDRGIIEINVHKSKNNILFEISNSGEIDELKLKQIQESINSDNIPSGTHIGLRNVNRRIKLVFGEQYNCVINSANGKTTTTITIPITNNLYNKNLI